MDPKWMQEGTMVAGYGGIGSHMDLIDDASKQKMLQDTKKAIKGVPGAPAIGYEGGVVAKKASSGSVGGGGRKKSPFELFNTPHKYGDMGKQIAHLSKGVAGLHL